MSSSFVDQIVLRYLAKCHDGKDLDGSVSLREGACCIYQKTSRSRCLSLHFITGVSSNPVHENTFKQGIN